MVDLTKITNKLKETYGSLRVANNVEDVTEFLSTGNLALDLALDKGGITLGNVVEFSGKSGSGKTLMMQLMLADMQKKYDAVGIWFDREKAWTNKRAEQLGIDLNNVIVVDPIDIPTVTDANMLAKDLLSKLPEDCYKFIAIDSISAFASGGKIDKSDMGKKAQELHNLFRTLLPFVDDKSILVFTNQRTFKIGVMFGDPSTTTGGEGPKFYTSYRLKLDDKKQIKDEKRGNEPLGNWIKATVIKTRSGPNYREVVFPFYYKEGIPYYGGYARMLADRNYLQPKNKTEFKAFKQSTLKYGEETVNEFKIEQFLDGHPELVFTEWPEWKEGVEVIED